MQATLRHLLRMESPGGIILGSLLSGVMGYRVLRLTLPKIGA